MSSDDPRSSADGLNEGRGWFDTTHWSVVLAAAVANTNSPAARAALEALCRTYWFPLFAHVRRRGYSAHDAQDLVQGFFARILERNDLQAVRQERGRFRCYLLVSLKHFLVNEWKHDAAQKRGGGEVPIPLDDLLAGHAGGEIPADERSPDRVFDRQWAIALLDRVFARLGEEQRSEGKEKTFACLKPFLAGQFDARPQAEIAAELGVSEGAVKQAVFRLRARYQKLLRDEVANTVATLGDVEDELRHLIAALRG